MDKIKKLQEYSMRAAKRGSTRLLVPLGNGIPLHCNWNDQNEKRS